MFANDLREYEIVSDGTMMIAETLSGASQETRN
jgi:hypothetical protein